MYQDEQQGRQKSRWSRLPWRSRSGKSCCTCPQRRRSPSWWRLKYWCKGPTEPKYLLTHSLQVQSNVAFIFVSTNSFHKIKSLAIRNFFLLICDRLNRVVHFVRRRWSFFVFFFFSLNSSQKIYWCWKSTSLWRHHFWTNMKSSLKSSNKLGFLWVAWDLKYPTIVPSELARVPGKYKTDLQHGWIKTSSLTKT